ncbi:hypothetical protein BAE44_0012769 [Dichanthelium oligosanthes]|uniref:Uncharacterized protein n=1 Tax=Dichanthelium oligosanthes TaxID=888268 RepID=A0A1E5VMB0_9POAL|nr:hypothetical protein BAE44_0012769 [Dichanthelium oligosanthes]
MGHDSAKKQRTSELGNSTDSTACLEVLQKMNVHKGILIKGEEEWRQDFKAKVEVEKQKESLFVVKGFARHEKLMPCSK